MAPTAASDIVTTTTTTTTATATPQFPPSDFTQRFAPSHDLIVSCGCVPVDPPRRKVALLHDPSTNTTQLPKGRKNIGEDLLAAALRETHEETGLVVEALPLRVATRATPSQALLDAHAHIEARPNVGDVTDWLPSCEPLAVCAYRCDGTLASKLVFWYAARGDSTATPRTDTREPWEQHLQLEWVDARHAAARMTHAADAQVVEKALADMRRSGYDI
ncbi:hypothetical protein TOPH_05444 [Tolypocladium ophioglossoides CBS 100239]|uniref:Nudix hydrolase domain-containing protein n=1 Tax=Tolypocladium ophioglossoides (strain CBS 100239) TaxID=1163406 RepID=A0A0L0N6Z7_TOLOC|nr:hypothetical protein TOPH_05444 [Tolypocladium ophioglossoides CBS 100239]